MKNSRNSLQTIFKRFMLIVAVFIFWIGVIGIRLVHLQVNQNTKFRKQALSQSRNIRKSKMLRGTIYDRTERALALSIRVNSLYADPMEIEDFDLTASRLSVLLKTSKSKILKVLMEGRRKQRRFVWLGRKLDQSMYEKINRTLVDEDAKKYDLPKFKGLHWAKEQKRKYPYKSLASHVVGFSNADDDGQAGIELSQEKLLRGDIVKTWQKRDRLGRVYEEANVELEHPKEIVLTISNSIQHKVEEELERGVKRANAKSGKAVVLNPKNGEILALANYPSFDPNEYSKLKPTAWKNRVIQDNHSPGSVFKLITYSAAIEEELIEPNEEVDCGNGIITINRRTFNDSHLLGKVSHAKAFAESSNVCAIKTGMRIGKDKFYQYIRDFGFGEKTGVELPAETRGLLKLPRAWRKASLASMSIGYEIGVTALQSASAFATIANDGVKIQLHIVKEIRRSDGKTVSKAKPERKRVVSVETARKLRWMLRQVVLDGTARQAQLDGYTSAGKTGTAWKYDKKLKAINKNKYVSSFIGFAPADNPSVVIAIVIDEPKGSMRYGGEVAAPIFRKIAEYVLPELNVVPDDILPSSFQNRKRIQKDERNDTNKENIGNKSSLKGKSVNRKEKIETYLLRQSLIQNESLIIANKSK